MSSSHNIDKLNLNESSHKSIIKWVHLTANKSWVYISQNRVFTWHKISFIPYVASSVESFFFWCSCILKGIGYMCYSFLPSSHLCRLFYSICFLVGLCGLVSSPLSFFLTCFPGCLFLQVKINKFCNDMVTQALNEKKNNTCLVSLTCDLWSFHCISW